MLEIRDKDLNLLYKFADGQNNYFLPQKGHLWRDRDTGDEDEGDFYVVFYDRGAAPIGAVEVADSGNSTCSMVPRLPGGIR